MDLKIYTSDLKLAAVADDYDTLRATRCYARAGELVLTTRPGGINAAEYKEGRHIYVRGHGFDNGYVIDCVERDGDTLTVRATGILSLFARRVRAQDVSAEIAPGAYLCALAQSAADALPGPLAVAAAGGGDAVEFSHDFDDVYSTMRDLCKSSGAGMRLRADYGARTFAFAALRPTDRTAGSADPFVLSRARESCVDDFVRVDASDYYNAAVVCGCRADDGTRYVARYKPDPSVAGAELRELCVDARGEDIKRFAVSKGVYDIAAYLASLRAIGAAALAAHRVRVRAVAALPHTVSEAANAPAPGDVVTFESGPFVAPLLVDEAELTVEAGATGVSLTLGGEI